MCAECYCPSVTLPCCCTPILTHTQAIASFEGGPHCSLLKAELPATLFPPTATRLMNDMAACAEGVLAVNASGAFPDLFRVLWEPSPRAGEAVEAASITTSMGPCTHALVAVGTGLGNISLLHLPDLPSTPAGSGAGHWLVVPMEAGHQIISIMPDDLSALVKDAGLTLRDPSGTFPAEWDDLCSGRGLEFVYGWCVRNSGTEAPSYTASDVAARWASDPLCEAAMLLHYRLIMRFTANFVITSLVCV